MKRGCLMVTVACVQCAEPIVMGPWSVEDVHFLTSEPWAANFAESTICNFCVPVSLAENNKCYDDVSCGDEEAEAADDAAYDDAGYKYLMRHIPADGTLR